MRCAAKEDQKEGEIVFDVKNGGGEWSQGKFRYLGEFSELKEIMAHFPGRKVFQFKWIDQLIATIFKGMPSEANKVALLHGKPCLFSTTFFSYLTKSAQ